MRTILIATDFSASSRNASVYGWQLAKALNARLILFTAYQVSHPIAALNMHISHFDVRMQTENKLQREANAITNDDSFKMEIVCEEGVAQEVILSIAAEKDADMIIVGMQGRNNNLKKLLGSTAISLINESGIPIIVVPEEAKYSAPKSLLYASDITVDTTVAVIDRIKWLTDFFGSSLHVVRVVSDGYEELVEKVNIPQNLRKELKTLHTTFHFPIYTNVIDGLNHFIKNEPVDLMIMMARKHEWIERIFVKSETKDMIFHSHVPLLILSEKLVEAADAGIFQEIENYSTD